LIGVVLLVVIPEATLILLDESWLSIVPVFRLMTVYVVLDPLYINLSYLVMGMGRPEILVRVRLGQVALFVAAVVALARGWGIQGIALAANLMMLTGVVALLVYCARCVRLELARVLAWPCVALAAACAAGIALSTGVQWSSLWWSAIGKGLGVSLVFGAVLWATEGRKLHQYGRWAFRVLSATLWRPTRAIYARHVPKSGPLGEGPGASGSEGTASS
jgi:O-antigen/teichoic acid export membrane protein